MRFNRIITGLIIFALMATLLLSGCGGAAEEPVPAQEGAVTVATVDELLSAIAPGVTVVLKSGEYELSAAESYGEGGGEFYYWAERYEGYELRIRNADGLCIMAEPRGEVLICTRPRYANVLRFEKCSGLQLGGLTVGHTEEEGSCTGGVLYFDGCRDSYVKSCALYGCGILGVFAENCRGLRVSDSKIYDCSVGAAQVYGSRNVLFEGCEIYDCKNGAVFDFNGGSSLAVINSAVHNNAADCFILSEGCKDVYVGGLEVRDNSFYSFGFCATVHPIWLEGCALENNRTPLWYENSDWWANEGCVDAFGNLLTDGDFSAMKKAEKVSWQPKEQQDTGPAPAVSEDGYIHVSTVDELLASIAPDTKIFLEDGEYLLSTASNYGDYVGDFYRWEQGYDGPALIIADVQGLAISGSGRDNVSIISQPRLADVLKFINCADLTLEGFTAGHTDEGACTGGVLNFEGCRAVTVDGCGLFGCGIVGITALGCENVQIYSTEIYDCSEAGVRIFDCDTVCFTDCAVRDNVENIIIVEDSRRVSFNGTELFTSSRNIIDADGNVCPAASEELKQSA